MGTPPAPSEASWGDEESAAYKPVQPITALTPREYKKSIKDLEVKDGHGLARGIKLVIPVDVLRQGAKKPERQTLQCVYRFDPDPHTEPRYNKKQAEFYQKAAAALAAHVSRHGRLPEPGTGFTVEFGGTTFTLVAMQRPLGGGFKIKTAPD